MVWSSWLLLAGLAVAVGAQNGVSQQAASPEPAALVSDAERKALLAEVHELRPRLTPRPVATQGPGTLSWSLDGEWRFHPSPGEGFGPGLGPSEGWSPIAVPGEWALQGFHVEPGTAAGYARDLALPDRIAGGRVKLRFDAVYSECTVWVNGHEAGRHLGGFTPFELDITALVVPDTLNSLRLAVRSESLADQLATASQYAAHPLGGILRKVQLFIVPEVHVASLRCWTELGDEGSAATLAVEVQLANEGVQEAKDLRLQISGSHVLDDSAPRFAAELELPALAPGGRLTRVERLRVDEPRLWDPEHPNLYDLELVLQRGTDWEELVSERIGLRQVEVRGVELLVNRSPVRLRGVNRHEVHPLRGRALTSMEWSTDALLYKRANCNFVRTSHYPPAEEFLAACDQVGLLVELEAPLCWIGHGANPIWQEWDYRDPRFYEPILQAELETVEASFNHPSVVLRSLANESAWSETFEAVAKRVAVADPTRPLTFHDQCWGDYNNHGSDSIPVANIHYPGPGGPERVAAEGRPVTFGEYCHLNTYNREEIEADPGVCEGWGRALGAMWESMVATPGCLGGSIWSGIDDVFRLPDGSLVGYGEWGPIDGWRRRKPEYWHLQQVFAPVHFPVIELEVPAPGEPLVVPVANRYDFTDLSEVVLMADPGGRVRAHVPPHSEGELRISPPSSRRWSAGDIVRVHIGWPPDESDPPVELSVGPRVPAVAPFEVTSPTGELRCDQRENSVAVTGQGFVWEVRRDTGRLTRGAIGDTEVVVGGPDLMLLPLRGGPCTTDFSADIVPFTPVLEQRSGRVESVEASPERVAVRVGEIYAEAEGGYTLVFDSAGGVSIDYSYEVTQAVDPRQIGLVILLAPGFESLSWSRDVPRPIRIEEHIGRPAGSALARSPIVHPLGRGGQPSWPWAWDENELGSNDFRATRTHVRWARLTDREDEGGPLTTGLGVLSDGTQAVRAWLDGERVRLLVAGFDTGGADMFLSSHYASERRPLEPGDMVTDTIRLQLVP